MKKWLLLIGGILLIIMGTVGIVIKRKTPPASAIGIIGGADGPTSIFLAGKVTNGLLDGIFKMITLSNILFISGVFAFVIGVILFVKKS